MTKKLLALLLAALMAVSFSACKKDDKDEDDKPSYKVDEIIITSVTVGESTFHFESVDSASVRITAYEGPSSLTDITIPTSVVTGADAATSTKTVVAIGNSAFKAKASLRSVVIPEGIKEIGDQAFAECVQLESVTFPSSLEALGVACFSNSGLKTLTFPETCALKEIAPSAFRNCRNLKEIKIPGYIETVRQGAFFGCEGVEKIVLAEGVRTLEKQAFQGAVALTDLELPASFTNTDPMQDLVFSGTRALRRNRIICHGDAATKYADKMVLAEG